LLKPILPLLVLLSVPAPLTDHDADALKIFVEQDRMYRVTGEEIAAAGLAIDRITPSKINVYNEGGSVPISIDGLLPEGRFGPSSTITFERISSPRRMLTRSRSRATTLRTDSRV
jgi:hypothetical protein